MEFCSHKVIALRDDSPRTIDAESVNRIARVVKADIDRLRAFYGPIRGKFPELPSTIAIKEERRSQIESD